MADFFISVSPKIYRLAGYDKEYREAVFFAIQLRELSRHPLIKDFNAVSARYKHKLHFTNNKYVKLLASAIRFKLAKYEGKHLRLLSNTTQRKLFNIGATHRYETIKATDIRQYYQIQILKHHAKQQKRAIAFKNRATAYKGSGTMPVNKDVILSCRAAARYLGLKSYSHANILLTKLKDFGLCLNKNRQQIDEHLYNFYKSIGKHNARFDKQTGQHYYLHASFVSFNHFYPRPVIKTKGVPMWENDNW